MFVSDLLTEQSPHNLLAERMHGIMMKFWAKHRDSRREHAIAAEGRHLAFHEIVDEHFLKASVSRKAADIIPPPAGPWRYRKTAESASNPS